MPKAAVVIDGKKECKRCLLWKPLDNFSIQKKNRTGRYSYCKLCVVEQYKQKYLWRDYTPERRAQQNANRRKRLDHYREKWRAWDAQHREDRRERSRARYRRDPQKEKARARRERQKRYLHHQARWAVNAAVRYGRMKKLPCVDCGAKERVTAHHHNGYQKEQWLDVLWLCTECHGKRHRHAEV